MTARNDDRLLSAWLHDIAPTREPEHLLGQVLARTARTRRRPAWQIPERWNPMSAISSRLAPTSPVPWRLIAVAAALLLALVAGIALLASGAMRKTAPPYGLAANGQVFYSQGGDVYAGPLGGQAHAILPGATNDSDPMVSPDGTQVSFLRHLQGDDVELWSMNVDGSNVRQLAIPYTQLDWFDWSPTGDAVVLLSKADPEALTVVPLAGGAPSRFELDLAIEQAIFRPSAGSQLSFMGAEKDGTRGIYLLNRDGTGLRRLNLDPGFENDPDYSINQNFYIWAMSWSPTGDRLLYTQLEPDPTSSAGAGFRNHLATVDAAGNVVSDEIIEFQRATDDEFVGVWAPSGDALVFQNVEGTRHWLSYAAFGSTGKPGPARDLGIEAHDYIASQISPDGTQLLAIMPAADGVTPVAWLVDLLSGTKTQVQVGADASWQRLGR